MNPVAAMFVAYACISHGDHKPDGFAMSRVYMCNPPRIEAAAVPVKPVRVVKRKSRLAARTDKCGSMRAVWYTRKDGHRKYRCR